MKKLFLLFGLFFGLTAATNDYSSEDIIVALKSGSASEVALHFDNMIDLTLPEKEEMKNMGKNQATIALKSFYEEVGVKTFHLTSQREAGSMMYITGKLQGKIKNCNITIILKNSNSKFYITSLRVS
ncbi:MAG: DUF4783 domain-containing protein [Chitinophagaceae bacterium]|nr:DUF4783 domain-containing protein [Chitinophagaceae bacterium]